MAGYLYTLKRFTDFGGRSRRREFWAFIAVNVVLGAIAAALDMALGLGGFTTVSTPSFVGAYYSPGIIAIVLGLVLLVLGPPAIVAVAVLGVAGLQVVAAGIRRLGSVGRLAAAPLVHQRSVLGPLVGVVAVVTSLAALDATVGASFGQREEDREEERPTITAPAGTTDHQVLAVLDQHGCAHGRPPQPLADAARPG